MLKNYRALTKLRQQQFDQAEQALAQVNAKLQELRRQKEVLRADMRAIEPPERGTGAQLGAVLAQKRADRMAIEALELQIDAVLAQKREKEQALKAAHIALEQAKSIEAQVLKALMRKRERLERNQLDEIAAQRFFRDRQSNEKEQEA